MAVPTFDELIEPLLRTLADQAEPVPVSRAATLVAERLKLSDSDLAAQLPNSPQSVFRNRIGWAHDRLKRAVLSSCPRRGLWQLTSTGREFARQNPSMSPEQVSKLAWVGANSPRVQPKIQSETADEIVPVAPASPVERIDDALEELRDSVARDLIELIFSSTPAFFEKLVLEVLLAMGYGESRKAILQLGRSGDEGVDGVISLDKLGLDRVYVQAKKWKASVGSPQIQAFVGALRLQGADKGVIITPGDFTRDAVEIAKKAHGNLVLIDGQRLTELMIEHRVGVSLQSLTIPQIDKDFFEDD